MKEAGPDVRTRMMPETQGRGKGRCVEQSGRASELASVRGRERWQRKKNQYKEIDTTQRHSAELHRHGFDSSRKQ